MVHVFDEVNGPKFQQVHILSLLQVVVILFLVQLSGSNE